MNDKANQLDQADAAIEKEVAAFMKGIEAMFGKWEEVERKYIAERTLLTLCDEMTKLLDEPYFALHMGSATLKLSNAMADYRDSRFEDRG
jgi:hypothetical protein